MLAMSSHTTGHPGVGGQGATGKISPQSFPASSSPPSPPLGGQHDSTPSHQASGPGREEGARPPGDTLAGARDTASPDVNQGTPGPFSLCTPGSTVFHHVGPDHNTEVRTRSTVLLSRGLWLEQAAG